MEEFDKRSVELLPDKMDLMTDTELTQYFMKTWSLDFNDPGRLIVNCIHEKLDFQKTFPDIPSIVFKRRTMANL